MKRIILFVAVNFAVIAVAMAVFHIACAFLGVSAYEIAGETGIDLRAVALFALVFGMTGSFISLLLSKPIAKWSVGAHTITGEEGETERWLVDTVAFLANQAEIKTPEVAVYRGEANAFATGAFRNHALVAVSSDIMAQMTREELRAVLGHEISHVANGDMVTMTLLQGVLNACVIFLSRVIAYLAANAGERGNRRRSSAGVYYLVYYIMQFVLGIAASLLVLAYSRRREYAADAGSARLLGSPSSMIAALRRLGNLQPGVLPESLKAFGISGKRGASIFSTHPSLDDRIAALQKLRMEASI